MAAGQSQRRRQAAGFSTWGCFVPLAVVYTSIGLFWGVFGVAFVDFVAARDFSFAQAGNLLAGMTVVAIVVMVFVVQHVDRLNRRWSIAAAVVLNGVGAAALVGFPARLLLVAFVLLGVGTALTDVLANAAGQETELRSGKPILQGLHGLFAAGVGAGALATGLALSAGVAFETLVLIAAGLQFLAAGYTAVRLPTRTPRRAAEADRISLSVFAAAPFLLVPATVLAAAYFIEGAVEVWGVLYLRTELGASPAVGSWGLVVFSFSLAAGRLLAARTLFRLGYRTTLLVSGLGSMVAGLAVVVAPGPAVASAAFLALGIFVAGAAPAAIGMVGETDADAGVAIAAISTLGYAGFAVGPPVMGWIADGMGMRAAMAMIVVLPLGLVVSAVFTRRSEAGSA